MRISAVLYIGVCLALPCVAQDKSGRGEFAVYVGEGHAGGKEGTYGKGMELGTSIEFQPLSRIGFMFDLNRLEHSGSISDVNGTPDHWDIEGTELQASGSIVYHFSDAPLEPYVLGGAGVLRSSRTVRITGDFKVFAGPACLVGCMPNIQPTRFEQISVEETKPAFHAGAGIRVPLVWRLSFRPEFRVVRAGNLHLVHAVFGLSYHW